MNWEALIAAFSLVLIGYLLGSARATSKVSREYRKAIDRACDDYREAARIIQKLRNRLAARRIVLLKQQVKTSDEH